MGVGGTAPRIPARPLAALLGVLLLTGACTQPPGGADGPVVGPSPSATPPSSLRVAVVAPADLDPRLLDSHEGLLVAAQLFDGLVSYDPETLAVVPAVAESWEMLDQGTRFRFRIRSGVTFHDGSAVTAESFVNAWNRLVDPVFSAPYAFLLESVKGFAQYQERLSVRGLSGLSAPDAQTLEVVLNRPWADFPSLLAHPALSPVPVTSGDDGFGAEPVGNGPYRMTAPLNPGAPVILQAYDGYYGVPALMPTLELHTVAGPDDAWPDFLSGELEIAEIPAPLVRSAQSQFGSRGVVAEARQLSCGFNEAQARFADPALRTAVSLALDRASIAEGVYGGVPLPATGIVPPTLPGYAADVCAENCAPDAERAEALVAEVPKKDRAFALDYSASTTGDQLAGEIAAQLGSIGLRVTPRPHDQLSFEAVLEGDQHEMFCLGAIADYPRQQALLEPVLASGSPDNHANVADPGIDALLEEARARRDAGARQALYADVEREALAAMHVIPVVWFRTKLAVQPYVRGFRIDPLGMFDAATISVGFVSPQPPAPVVPDVPAPDLPGPEMPAPGAPAPGVPGGVPGGPPIPVPGQPPGAPPGG